MCWRDISFNSQDMFHFSLGHTTEGSTRPTVVPSTGKTNRQKEKNTLSRDSRDSLALPEHQHSAAEQQRAVTTCQIPGKNCDGKLTLRVLPPTLPLLLSFFLFVALFWPSRKFNTAQGEKKSSLEEADFPREADQSAITANTGNVPGVISRLSRNLCNLFLHQSHRNAVAEESGC